MSKRIIAIVVFIASLCGMISPVSADQRVTWYYGQQPSSQNQNLMQRGERVARGTLASTIFGTNGYANLTIAPISGLTVAVEPVVTTQDGALYQVGADDTSAWGGGPLYPGDAVPADTTQITVQALVSGASPSLGPLTVPSSSGQSQISMVECQVVSSDNTNQSNLFISSVGTLSYNTVPTFRTDGISCQTKTGTASTSPTVPSTDSGWVGIGYVTVPYGTATITTGMVTMFPQIAPKISGSGANITAGTIPNNALATTPLVALSPGPNIVVGSGTTPSVAVTAAPSFNSLTVSGLTAGNCVQAGTGGTLTTTSGACGLASGTITSVTGTSNIVVTGPTTAPVVAVTNAPTFTGTVTAGSFSGSGAGLTAGSVPNAALATPPVTALTPGPNIVVGTGTVPSVAVTAAPSFSSVTVSGLTSGNCVQASTGGLLTTTTGACGVPGVTTLTGAGNIVVTGSTASPTVAVTNAPTFTGSVTAASHIAGSSVYGATYANVNGPITSTQFNGSGAGLTAGTVPNGSLVTPALTGLTAGSNAIVGTGVTPSVAITSAPTFSGPVSASQFNGSGAGVTTTPSGASVASTLPTLFSRVLHAADFGAVCNGTNVDTTAIQNGITASAGKALFVIDNTGSNCVINNTINVPSNAQIELDGTLYLKNASNSSVFTMASGATNVVFTGHGVINGNGSGQTGYTYGPVLIGGDSVSNVWIHGLTLENAQIFSTGITNSHNIYYDHLTGINNNQGIGFSENTHDCWANDLDISGTQDSGFAFYGGVYNCGISNSHVTTSTAAGIDVQDDSGQPAESYNLVIEGNVVDHNADGGIYINNGGGTGADPQHITVTGNVAYSNSQSGIFVLGGDHVVIASNETHNNQYDGIQVGAATTYITVNGNQVGDEGQGGGTGGSPQYGIEVLSGATHTVVLNNHIWDDQSTPTTQYGLSGTLGAGSAVYNNTVSGTAHGVSQLVTASDTQDFQWANGAAGYYLSSPITFNNAVTNVSGDWLGLPGNNGAGNATSIGSNASQSVAGVAGSALKIYSNGNLLTLDGNGDLGIAGNLFASGVTSTGTVSAPTLSLGGGISWTTGSGAPSGSCTSGSMYTNNTASAVNTTLYACRGSAWHAITGG